MAVATSVLVLAAGCAGQGSDGDSRPAGSGQAVGPAAQPTPAQPTPAPAQPPRGDQTLTVPDKTIVVRINEGKVEGAPARVEVGRGDQVRIEVTSDRRDELHVHGYDKTAPLLPGTPAALQFVADLTGVFEVETHDSGLLLFQLVVRG